MTLKIYLVESVGNDKNCTNLKAVLEAEGYIDENVALLATTPVIRKAYGIRNLYIFF